jgi:hypothetical protein
MVTIVPLRIFLEERKKIRVSLTISGHYSFFEASPVETIKTNFYSKCVSQIL